MKSYALGLLIAAGTLLAAGCYPNNQPTNVATVAPSKNSVAITNGSYQPPEIVIYKGQSVTWVNNDTVVHTVTGQSFNSGNIAPGSFYSYQFNKRGTYYYYCKFHPNMKGEVVVK